MPGSSQSLSEYAQARGGHRKSVSWMEGLPPEVLEQARQGWRDGLRHTVIVEWLVSIGYPDATSGKVAWLAENA